MCMTDTLTAQNSNIFLCAFKHVDTKLKMIQQTNIIKMHASKQGNQIEIQTLEKSKQDLTWG